MVQTNNVSVVSVKHPVENIFRIEIERPDGFSFTPGQFARIGINPNNGCSDKIWRAQTIISGAVDHKTLIFFIVYLEGKPFSDALKKIKSGDNVCLDAVPYGYFTLDRFGPGETFGSFLPVPESLLIYVCFNRKKFGKTFPR